jgi:hypothetical protein
MGGLHSFGFEVAKFFGEKGLDFLFAEAEMQGFGDELVEGGTDLAAACFDLEGRRLMGNIGAETAPRFDETLPFENLVDLGNGEGIDAQFRGEVAHGRELFTVEKLAREDALLELLLQLHVERDAAGGVEKVHGVILQ